MTHTLTPHTDTATDVFASELGLKPNDYPETLEGWTLDTIVTSPAGDTLYGLYAKTSSTTRQILRIWCD